MNAENSSHSKAGKGLASRPRRSVWPSASNETTSPSSSRASPAARLSARTCAGHSEGSAKRSRNRASAICRGAGRTHDVRHPAGARRRHVGDFRSLHRFNARLSGQALRPRARVHFASRALYRGARLSDLTLILDLPAGAGVERAQSRGTLSRYDAERIETHEALRRLPRNRYR